MYHEQVGCYPALRYETYVEAVSWAFRILPYLEQQAIFDAHHWGTPCYENQNAAAFRTPVAVFDNPSRRRPRAHCLWDTAGTRPPYNGSPPAVGATACGDYAANYGAGDVGPPFVDETSGPIIGCWDYQSGKVYRVNAAMVRDGLSNTLLVGDKWIGPPPSNNYHCNFAFFTADQPAASARGTQFGFPAGPDDSSVYKFGNPVGSQACFVFCDGRVTWLDYSMSLGVLQSLSACADGMVIDDAY